MTSNRDGRSKEIQATNVTIRLKGHTINDVECTFLLDRAASENMQLRGLIALKNPTASLKRVYVSEAFEQHLMLFTNDTEFLQYKWERRGDSYRTRVYVEPGETNWHRFKLDLEDYYELFPGEYEIGFRYDVRLERKALPGENPFIQWSKERLRIKLVRRDQP